MLTRTGLWLSLYSLRGAPAPGRSGTASHAGGVGVIPFDQTVIPVAKRSSRVKVQAALRFMIQALSAAMTGRTVELPLPAALSSR